MWATYHGPRHFFHTQHILHLPEGTYRRGCWDTSCRDTPRLHRNHRLHPAITARHQLSTSVMPTETHPTVLNVSWYPFSPWAHCGWVRDGTKPVFRVLRPSCSTVHVCLLFISAGLCMMQNNVVTYLVFTFLITHCTHGKLCPPVESRDA